MGSQWAAADATHALILSVMAPLCITKNDNHPAMLVNHAEESDFGYGNARLDIFSIRPNWFDYSANQP
jgi:hypothetical protein